MKSLYQLYTAYNKDEKLGSDDLETLFWNCQLYSPKSEIDFTPDRWTGQPKMYHHTTMLSLEERANHIHQVMWLAIELEKTHRKEEKNG